MSRPSTRVVVLSVATLLLAAVLGAAGYLHTRADNTQQSATTVRVDEVDHPCGRHGIVGVEIEVTGPGDARFAVDGVEVPARQIPASQYAAPYSTALLPEPVQSLRCDDGAVHRFTALVDTPEQCRWTIASPQTQEEALGHEQDLSVSGTGCAVTVVD